LVFAAGIIAAAAVMPFDPLITRAVSSITLGGDVKREMEFLQQFGAITSCLIIACVIWLLDPARRKDLPRAALACIASAAVVFVLKSLVGRARPRLREPWHFAFPWEQYTIARGDRPPVSVYAWEFWRGGVSDIWSLPSGHTASAFALASVLSRLYPALMPLVLPIACLVGICRVVLGAHYPSDVIIGGALGWCIAGLAPVHGRGKG